MRISAFRVTNYRSIIDSSWIDLADLTVLIGKNESGKTSLLRALHKFKPFRAAPYAIDREWPRGRRQSRDPAAVVCRVGFELDERERAELTGIGDAARLVPPIVVAKRYDGTFAVELPPEHFPERPPQATIDSLFAPIEAASQAHAGTVPGHVRRGILAELRRLALAGRFDDLLDCESVIRKALSSHLGSSGAEATGDPEFIARLAAMTKEAAAALKTSPSIRQIVADYVLARLPTFIYMDDYSAFRGAARLDQIHRRKQQNALTDEDRTLLTIMALAGLDLEREVAQGESEDPAIKEQRQYDLNDAGLSLTNEIAQRWQQRKYEVQFRADGHAFFTMVKDSEGPYLIPLEERSKGFQWFFSFDLMFMHESRGTFGGCVLLLDEPGLHLHADAQRDLLARLEAYARENRLIYTTHLPFMIDLRRPERIRTVSESGNGTVVDKDLGRAQAEAKLTLQAALGIAAARICLVARRNLVVAGVDDFRIIGEMSNLLVRSRFPGLPDDLRLTAAGSAAAAAALAAFMVGQKTAVAVLLDSGGPSGDAAGRAIADWLSRYHHGPTALLTVGELLGRSEATAIEDLFDETFYLAQVQGAHEGALRAAGVSRVVLSGTGPIAKRVERAFAGYGVPFDKSAVAALIGATLKRMPSIETMRPETRERILRLIGALAASLPADPPRAAERGLELAAD